VNHSIKQHVVYQSSGIVLLARLATLAGGTSQAALTFDHVQGLRYEQPTTAVVPRRSRSTPPSTTRCQTNELLAGRFHRLQTSIRLLHHRSPQEIETIRRSSNSPPLASEAYYFAYQLRRWRYTANERRYHKWIDVRGDP